MLKIYPYKDSYNCGGVGLLQRTAHMCHRNSALRRAEAASFSERNSRVIRISSIVDIGPDVCEVKLHDDHGASVSARMTVERRDGIATVSCDPAGALGELHASAPEVQGIMGLITRFCSLAQGKAPSD